MDKITTACFSGYRSEKFEFPLEASCPEYVRLLGAIRLAIADAVAEGYVNFLVGMADGFYLLAGETLLEMRLAGEILGEICITAVLPFREHRVSGQWHKVHQRVWSEADERVVMSLKYYRGIFLNRNKSMVNHSSRLICYYTGLAGGTAHTIREAIRQGLHIVNVAELKDGHVSIQKLLKK